MGKHKMAVTKALNSSIKKTTIIHTQIDQINKLDKNGDNWMKFQSK
jgi:hypothetical protein